MTGARRLQISTEEYQQKRQKNTIPTRRRSRTVHNGDSSTEILRYHSEIGLDSLTHPHPIGIEQIVHQAHMSADGIPPICNRKKTYEEEVEETRIDDQMMF